ncbi:unnamed protein product [Prorocentrum cordatum]|uniref:Uncharacterized protein n=1 Tax=Prorocentrum cordatum TaxID=2364126 RepID=A0ABN9QV33_9DINO|nr:unnamed protein product [Polarella glacialis]
MLQPRARRGGRARTGAARRAGPAAANLRVDHHWRPPAGTSLQAAPPFVELKRHASAPTPARPPEAAGPALREDEDDRPPPGLGGARAFPEEPRWAEGRRRKAESDFGAAMAMSPYDAYGQDMCWGPWPPDFGAPGPPPPGLHAHPPQPGWLTRATSAPAALSPCFGGGWGAPPPFGGHPAEALWGTVGLEHHAGGFYDADPYRDTAHVTRGVNLSAPPPAPAMPPPPGLLSRASSASGAAAMPPPPGLAPREPGAEDPTGRPPAPSANPLPWSPPLESLAKPTRWRPWAPTSQPRRWCAPGMTARACRA